MRNKFIITCSLGLFATMSLSADSLWHSKKNSEKSMYADRVAGNVGDILSVQVAETTSVNRTSSKNTSSSTNISHDVNSFFFPPAGTGGTGTRAGTHNGTLPSLSISPVDSFNGEGSFSDTNVIEGRIAVIIYDKQPNGNLLVEGVRKIESNGESQFMIMKGIVRADDVMSDNSVMSYNILNANVELLGEGDLEIAQRKGRLNQLIDALNIL